MRLVVRFALAAALGAAALPAHAQNPTSSAIAAAQAGPAPANAALDLSSGEAIYKSGCITCHGPTGAGMPSTTVGFEQPDTFPDFTRCDQTTPELDIDYSAIIRDGGPARGFSPIMPAFGDLLTRTQIAAVVRYLRGFCGNHTWPLGELNLPRPLVTEKAFPESETIVTGAVTAQRSPDTTGTIQYEQRLSLRNQFEISLPLAVMHDPSGAARSGVGDVALGLKHVLFSSRASGSLLSAQGEIIVPTGNADRGLGSGTTVFEAFGAFAQLLPRDLFLQLQAGTEQPTDIEKASRAVYGHAAFGRMFRAGGGFGRLWSPMVELIADRDLETGASANFDLIPQFQVTLSRRQHVRVNAGLQVPVNNRDGRSTQVVFYALWDWFDGRLTEGW